MRVFLLLADLQFLKGKDKVKSIVLSMWTRGVGRKELALQLLPTPKTRFISNIWLNFGCRSLSVNFSWFFLQGALHIVRACAMTTKFFDNKICTFKIVLSWRFPTKNSVLDDFPLCPQGPSPSKIETFIFIVVSLSLILDRA